MYFSFWPICQEEFAYQYTRKRLVGTLPNSNQSFGNWRDGKVGPDQTAFILQARRIVELFDVQVWYDLNDGGYVWQHLMPLFHVLPGKVVVPRITMAVDAVCALTSQVYACRWPREALKAWGIAASDVAPQTVASVRAFLGSSRRHLLLCANGRLCSYPSMGSFSSQVQSLPHGSDEDHLWERDGVALPVSESPPLVFTNYLKQHLHANTGSLLAHLRPGLRTVLYLGTLPINCDSQAFISPLKQCRPPNGVVSGGLRLLAESNNVVVRPHPGCLHREWALGWGLSHFQRLCPRCVIDYTAGTTPADTAALADVIVMEPSASIHQVLDANLSKPIVYVLGDKRKYDCVRSLVMNEDMVEVFFPDNATEPAALLDAVARASGGRLAERPRGQVQLARQNYLRMNYGDIDGYEEYRLAAMVLQSVTHGDHAMAREVARLQQIMASFTNATTGSDLVSMHNKSCTMDCCKSFYT